MTGFFSNTFKVSYFSLMNNIPLCEYTTLSTVGDHIGYLYFLWVLWMLMYKMLMYKILWGHNLTFPWVYTWEWKD